MKKEKKVYVAQLVQLAGYVNGRTHRCRIRVHGNFFKALSDRGVYIESRWDINRDEI